SPDCRMALQAIRSLVHRREPAGSRRQHRARIGRSGGAGRLHAGRLRIDRITQRDPVHRPQVDLKFSFMRDTAPVASMMLAMNVLVVHPAFSVRSVPELIAAAKANPGALTVASAGVGSTSHVFWELFRSMTGTRMLHVPYRGGAPALTDLLGRQVQVHFATPADTMEYIKTGKLLALAVPGAPRAQGLRCVPTMGEFVTGYEAVGWWGVAPQKEPPGGIIDLQNKAINGGLAAPKIKQPIAVGGEPVVESSPAEFGR